MIGDVNDIRTRLKAYLAPWFGDETPNLDAILTGAATVFSFNYSQTQYAKLQTRITREDRTRNSATDIFLDLISQDFFGKELPRCPNESDEEFFRRIIVFLLTEKATRTGMFNMIKGITGHDPVIFEPGIDGFFLNYSFLNVDSLGGIEPYTVYIVVKMPEPVINPDDPFFLNNNLFLDFGFLNDDPNQVNACVSEADVARYIGADVTIPPLPDPVPNSVLQTKPIGIKAIVYFV